MPHIKPLPDQLINQIAAGEMIERPASIIKELAENAIDAGATRIDIDIEEGGIKLIRMADNGCGIEKQELPLALMRHATSKIYSFDDLLKVMTMGFRGEALASIASAANMSITTRTASANEAAMIEVKGGQISAIKMAHRAPGTTIVVQDLFFNIPARRHFLKTETTEAAHCFEAVRRLALVHPNTAWKLTHNGRQVFMLPIQDIEARVPLVLGQNFRDHVRHFSDNSGQMHISGLLTLPSGLTVNPINGLQTPSIAAQSRSREMQYVYINKRFVRDRTVIHAVKDGYAEMKHDAKVLNFVIYIEMPPDEVDVNVSPSKTEVRFRHAQAIHQMVRQSVRKALSSVAGQQTPIFSGALSAINARHTDVIRDDSSYTHAGLNRGLSKVADRQTGFGQGRGTSTVSSAASFVMPRASAQTIEQAMSLYQTDNAAADHHMALDKSNNPHNELNPAMPPLGFALGLLHHLYIVAQNAEGLVLVEIHAAHERLLFERLKAQQADKNQPRQILLVPWRMNLSDEQVETFNQHAAFFSSLGLDATLQDHNELVLEAVPAILSDVNFATLMAELLVEVADYNTSQKIEERREAIYATIACHSARRGRQEMTIAQMNAMLREMEIVERSGTCNHGRPSYSLIPLSHIDAFFLRGQ